jgi:putative ABC transport system permease protein
VLGVAILFGVLVSNATTQTGVDTLITDFTGAADVLVGPTGAFDSTLPASVVPRLRRLPDVREAVGSFNLRSSIATPAVDEPVEISLRGIERASAERLQPYLFVAGTWFEPDARAVLVSLRLATKLSASLGDRVPVATPFGARRMTNQGDVAFTSIGTARGLAHKGRVVSGARLVLEPGTDIDDWITAHERALGAGLDFQNVETLAEGFQNFLSQLGIVFTFFAAITLFVGAFLIYLSLSMAVIERTRVYGTMRALGATRTQVRRVVLAEAIVLGAASTVVGLGLGLVIAKGLLAMVSGLFEIDLPGLTVTPGALVAGIVVGLVTTVVSSLIPARRASRLAPVIAMKGDYGAEARLSRAWIAGIVAAVAGTALALAANGQGAAGSFSTPLILLGAVLLVPPLLRPLARVLGRLTNRIAGGPGEIAVLHLVKERSRSAYTLALIMVVMAMIFSIGGLFTSMSGALDDTLDRQFGADVQIDSRVALAGTFEDDLRATPGVGSITAIRYGRADLPTADPDDDEETFAIIVDPATYFDVEGFAWSDGSDADARRALAAGGSVLMTEIAATEHHKDRGDTIQVDTGEGTRRFTIAATFASFTGPPLLVFGLPDGRRYLGAGDASEYHVDVAKGADPGDVKDRIERGLGARYQFVVTTALDQKQDAQKQFNQYFNIIYAILLVAAIVGMLGLANTLAMSVLQRVREIGVLRAIGTTRGQVRRMVLVESATLGLVAFVLALPLGWFLSVLTVRGISDGFGFEVDYVYPAAWVPAILAFGMVAAVLTSIAPGRRAARLEVVEALQYE